MVCWLLLTKLFKYTFCNLIVIVKKYHSIHAGNESMLYYTTFPYNRTQLFSTDLGRFQSGSFVLEYEYIFVQVSEIYLLIVKFL